MGNLFSLLPVGDILTQVCNCFFSDANYIHTMKTDLENLKRTMERLKEKRDDLRRKVSGEEDKGLKQLAQVEGWFSRVQSFESEVSELLDVEATETQRLCLFEYCSNNCISSYEYGKKVSKKLGEVQELLSQGDFTELAVQAPIPNVVNQHIQTTIGLDSMVKEAWKILKSPEGTTLGLYGMGGVGKTTLLARINNKFTEEKNEYDVVVWVVVSQNLQIESIQNQILGRLRLDKDWEQETEEKKVSSISKILSGKKFVLLLDDLWSEIDLNKIGVPSPTQDNGSKMVFSTRSKEVCRAMKPNNEMEVKCLLIEEAWELFQNTIGEIPLKRHEDIPKLAREVAKKCYGLPLALTVIGKAMACKEDVREWRHALKVLNLANHEFPGMEKEILSLLKFSYDGLGDENVKSCFLYCSLFPEDYEIEKEKLIDYWIGEGFINGNREEDGSNNQGHVIIGSLVRANLLIELGREMDYRGESTEKVKMHDVLREMALWISSDFVKSGGQLKNIPNNIEWEVVRRISLMYNQIKEIYGRPNCSNLLTLLLRNNKLKSISGEFFRFMPSLVVLDLSNNSKLNGVQEDISTLSSLKYLNLSDTKIESLPVGLKGLNKLISLDLENTTMLQSIDGIGTSLPNLKELKLLHSHVFIDARVMEELQLLEQLEILTGSIKDPLILERIQGVKRLANIIRKLSLRKMSEAVVILNTTALVGLQCLNIIACDISEIKIDCGREELLYTNDPGFKQLYTIYLLVSEGQKDLTWLLFAKNLRNVRLVLSGSIEEIINEEKAMRIRNMHPSIGVPFAKLEYLDLKDLRNLKRICLSPPALPKLKKLDIYNCPNLPEVAIVFSKT